MYFDSHPHFTMTSLTILLLFILSAAHAVPLGDLNLSTREVLPPKVSVTFDDDAQQSCTEPQKSSAESIMENFLVAQLGVPLADIVFDSKFDGDCKVLFGNVHFYGDVQLEKDGKYQPPVPLQSDREPGH
ncbi:hypothetical protein BT96DRAFT_683336 [Gymnopus androsaceus JB14]|uniref:Uncharacterized protein n=1 Tax=Gymnopus androsaceus JB14 TaxID=1447944 RepID=A0A6A4HRT7_9AGAR|nr:hypothetical protein BT96DRAFT_683336 [Gymnopus androsaceus JB14]